MATKALTTRQQSIRRALSNAESTVLAYAAPEVPPMGNLTLQGMVEELGFINEARKALEGTEKIIKERIKSLLDGQTEVRSDNFTLKYENRSRTALNQTRAKEKLDELGILPEYMDETSVPTMTIKAN